MPSIQTVSLRHFTLVALLVPLLNACGGRSGENDNDDGGRGAGSSETYTISGTITGLTGVVTLQLNNLDMLTVSANGAFTFDSALAIGQEYSISIVTQPTGQSCSVTNGNGTVISGGNALPIITCINTSQQNEATFKLNDTGITTCGDYAHSYTGYTGSGTHNNKVDCINEASPSATPTLDGQEIGNGLDAVPAGQDAVYGRDADPNLNDDSNGHKGFSFTKLDARGQPLTVQDSPWSGEGDEGQGTRWSCVRDNVTGLTWEIKTNDGGLRDGSWLYTWYNSTGANDGGDHGIGDTGEGTTTGFENSSYTGQGSNDCANPARCDTEKYVADVNAAALCGYSDWRLPTAFEISNLHHLGRYPIAIEDTYFPDAISRAVWSASTHARYGDHAWGADSSGTIGSFGKQLRFAVRLVRGGH